MRYSLCSCLLMNLFSLIIRRQPISTLFPYTTLFRSIALFVAPLLVAVGVALDRPMNLVFTSFEVAALGFSALIVTIIGLDGESHWFEGAQLLALYALIAVAVWFI